MVQRLTILAKALALLKLTNSVLLTSWARIVKFNMLIALEYDRLKCEHGGKML